jgi:ubiquinone/menaquinone biosynthesis C-methylase UbiE
MAERYARMPILDEASYEIKLEKTRACFRADSRVLEFGCGTGSTAIAHAPHVADILAIDTAGKMLAIARERAATAGVDNVRFEQGTLMDIDSPDASWDAVMGMSILHLLPDRADTIARVFKLLKPGGLFITSTICLGDASLKLRLLAPLIRCLPMLPDVRALRFDDLQREMAAAGFTIEETWRPAPDKAGFIVARKPPRLER